MVELLLINSIVLSFILIETLCESNYIIFNMVTIATASEWSFFIAKTSCASIDVILLPEDHLVKFLIVWIVEKCQ